MIRRLDPAGGLVLASHNAGKLREFEALLAPFGIAVTGAGALGLVEPVEDAATFAGNAAIKALAAARATGRVALADDSGFCVAALGGRPGVHSARFATDFTAAMARVRDEAGDAADRRAWFVCALCLAWPDGVTRTYQGRVDGEWVWPPRGGRGFGYDPMFRALGATLTYGEMEPGVKEADSHRARALSQVIKGEGLCPHT